MIILSYLDIILFYVYEVESSVGPLSRILLTSYLLSLPFLVHRDNIGTK